MSTIPNTILKKSYVLTFWDTWKAGDAIAVVEFDGSYGSLHDYIARLTFDPEEETIKSHWFSRKRTVILKRFRLTAYKYNRLNSLEWGICLPKEQLSQSVIQMGNFYFVCDLDALKDLFQAIEKAIGEDKEGRHRLMCRSNLAFYESLM